MPENPAARRETGVWFTSSFSNDGNSCVQVRFDGGTVLVADSKQRGTGPVIRLAGPDWDSFVATALGSAPSPAALRITCAPRDGRTVTAADGTALHFTAGEWAAFVAGAAAGEFRRPAHAGAA
ncbi:MAG: DUF397 domain-containing protein [Pseudonocardia sp.]|nr:DUF397 domain-containing protein [Pseudonocardia sp.]